MENNFLIHELSFYVKPKVVFKFLEQYDNLIFLNSCFKNYSDNKNSNRYSYIAIEPFAKFMISDGYLFYNEQKITQDNEKIVQILQDFIDEHTLARDDKYNIPFFGGLMGFVSYEYGFKNFNFKSKFSDTSLKESLFFSAYNNVIIFDELNNSMYLSDCGFRGNQELFTKLKTILKDIEHQKDIIEHKINSLLIQNAKIQNKEKILSSLKSRFSQQEYIKAIKTIKDYIEEGEVYQVNLSQQFSTINYDNSVDLFCKLQNVNPAPFSAYVDIDKKYQILSCSPECFVKLNEDKIITEPIKGTIKKGITKKQHSENRLKLINSEKDKSEHLMIVDLQRNDLSRICLCDSVEVEELFGLYEFPKLYHMISSISGKLKNTNNFIADIFDMLPGGSITGAPKKRAIQIIDELERNARHIYTGSIGYIGFNRDSNFNIVIRTVIKEKNKVYFNLGGGIVWDSDPLEEYEETLLKGQSLMEVLSHYDF